MFRRIPLFLVLPALLLLGACSNNPATGKQSFTAFMSPEKEIQVGTEEHPKMVQQFGGEYGDRALRAYVRNLGLSLAKTSEMPDLPWTFTVLNDNMVNAFALPGGFVYVTRGLLALASDEAELAGVLSHEIGHVTARHSAQRYSSTVAANIGVQVLGVLSQAAGLGRAGGDLASIGANVALKSYSREQELESDMLGVRYMTRIGYDPQALVSFFDKLRAHQAIEAKLAGKDAGAIDENNILSTHPRTADRIQQAIKLAQQNGQTTARREADEYLARIDGMVFGDDPEQGLVRGNVFIHPTLGFRFEVPDGFEIKNLPDIVMAVEKSGALIKFAGADAKEVRGAGGMEKYMLNKWGDNIGLGNIEWLDINGMKAVTGAATVWSGKGNVDVRRILIEQNKDTYWRFQFETPPKESARLSEPLRRTTYSLRKPTPGELAKADAYRVRVVKVGSGVRVADMIDAMVIPDLKAEWFEALNGLKADDALTPGQKVKVIK